MELGQLRALRELGDRGSIAAVAAALHVSPSSVSQQISALQRASPAPLTVKDGRRMTLTDAGRALAAAAVGVEVALERAAEAVARFQGDPSGTVSVAAFHSAGLAMFGGLIAAGAGDRSHGEVAVAVELSDFDVAQEDFPRLTADHDLVLAHRLVGSPPWPATVRVEPLLFEPLDIAMPRDHRLAEKAAIEPADLGDAEWVAVHEGFPLERAIAVIAGSGGSVRTSSGSGGRANNSSSSEARIRHRINDFAVAATVVAASGCIALMPRYTTELHEHPELVLRPLAHPGLGRHIDCLARPETLERASVATVLAQIRSLADGLTRPQRA